MMTEPCQGTGHVSSATKVTSRSLATLGYVTELLRSKDKNESTKLGTTDIPFPFETQHAV